MAYIDYLRKKLWLQITVCALTALFYIYDYFIQVSPSVITNQLMRAWSLNAGSLSTVLAGFSLAYVVLQVPAGMIFAKYGVRRVFSLVVLVASIGVIIFSGAQNGWTAAAGRFLIGAGSAFAFLGTLNFAAQWLSHRYFAMIAGIVQLAGCTGSIIAQEPLARLVTVFTWREVLFVAGLICAGMGIIFWFTIRDNNKYLPCQTTKTRQLPILMKVFRTRQSWAAFIISFCGWAAVGGFASLWGVPYLVGVEGFHTAVAGSHLIWFWLAVGFGSPLFGYITAYVHDFSKPISACFLLGLLGFAGIMTLQAQSNWWLDGSLLLLGLGCSSQSLSFGALKNHVTKTEFATATGVNNLMAIAAGALLQLSAGYIIYWLNPNVGHQNTTEFSVHSFMWAFTPVGFCLLIGFITSAFFLDGKAKNPK